MTLALSTLVCLTCLAHQPQDPFPKPGADPTGIVLDEANQPIPNAKVTLHCDLTRSKPWQFGIEQVLRAMPIRPTLTDKDGQFVLPMTEDQRRLGATGTGRFVLLIEKEGYQRWCEALPEGPHGYLGSRAFLSKLDPADVQRVVVEGPQPGMLVLCKRNELDSPEPVLCVAVPADGKLAIHLPFAPNPAITSKLFHYDRVGWQACLVHPGRTTDWRFVERDRELRFPVSEPARTQRVTRDDGQPVSELRMLGACPDGETRWFALREDRLPEDPKLWTLGVILAAEGCPPQQYQRGPDKESQTEPVLRTKIAEADLDAEPDSPTRTTTLTVRVTDDLDTPLVGASVLLRDDCTFSSLPARERGDPDLRHTVFDGPPPRTDARGEVRLEGIVAGHHGLLVVATGHAPKQQAFFVRRIQLPASVAVKLARSWTACVRTVDERGRAVRYGAFWTCSVPEEGAAETPQPQELRSDSAGRRFLAVPMAGASVTLTPLLATYLREEVRPDREQTILAPSTRSWLLRLSPATGVHSIQFRNPGGNRGLEASLPQAGSFLTLLMPGPVDEEHPVQIQLIHGAPLTLLASDGARGGSVVNGALMLDRTRAVRDVPLTILDAEGKDLADVCVVSYERTHALAHLTSLAVTDPQSPKQWRLQAYDREKHELVALHPLHLDHPFTMPAAEANAAGAPIKLQMQRGAGLTLRFTPARLLRHSNTTNLTVRLRPKDAGGDHRMVAIPLPESAQTNAKAAITVTLPRGFRPGMYALDLMGTVLGPRDIDLSAPGTLLLDVDALLDKTR